MARQCRPSKDPAISRAWRMRMAILKFRRTWRASRRERWSRSGSFEHVACHGGTVIAHLNEGLLILHFIGLALGFSVSFANIVMAGIIAKATPPEKAVLGRFPPLMSRVGTIGLTLLWATGVTMVYTKWGGFAALPWQFDVKIAA